MRSIVVAAVLTLAPLALADVSLTVYSSADPQGFDAQQFVSQQRMGNNPGYAWQVPGFGVVKDVRTLRMKQGTNELNFTDVAAFIDPTTVSFADLDQPQATAVLEQQFLFDLVSPDKLLEKYIDREVTVRTATGNGEAEVVKGTLLSTSGGQLVIKTADGVRLLYRGASTQVLMGEVPGGLITKPTLRWLVNSTTPGSRKVRTTYQTAGITWKADYNLLLSADDKTADLSAWVTMINLSGITYPDAELKLIAGDVQRVGPPMPMAGRFEVAAKTMSGAADAFQEQAFDEYHMYTLPRRTTVAQNTTQQIALFPTISGAAVEKVLVYEGAPQMKYFGYGGVNTNRDFGDTSGKKVDVYIRFKNTAENKLGIPLPKGKIRVFKAPSGVGNDAAAGAPEFIGEDLIDHTAKNETVLVRTGQAFDVTGTRTQTDFTIDTRGHVITESFRIEIANAKPAAQKVVIREPLYRWSSWQITKNSMPFEKIDSRQIQFEVTAPAEGKTMVEYTVKYTW